jgi:hypothetical protein
VSKNKWSKYFRFGQMTNFGTNLAAIITAVVAFFTLIQIKKQTEYSYRPDVMVQGSAEYLYLAYDKEIKTVKDFQWSNSAPERKDTLDFKSNDQLSLDIVNIGLAAAKEIELEWEFAVSRMTQEIQFKTLALDTKSQNIPDDSRSQLLINNSLLSIPSSFYFEHLLPINQSNIPLKLEIFSHYLLLWANVVTRLSNLNLPDTEKNELIVEFIESCPELKLNLKYLDIGQKSYQKTYSLKLMPSFLDMVNQIVKVKILCLEEGNTKYTSQNIQSLSIQNNTETSIKIKSIQY